jgi:hypothetical protein
MAFDMPVWLNQDEHLTCNQTHRSSNLLSGFMVPRPRQRGAVLVRRSRWVQFPLAPSKWETWCKRKHGRPWTCRSGVRSPPSPLTTEWQRRYALPRKGSLDRCKSGLRHKAASPTGRQPVSKTGGVGSTPTAAITKCPRGVVATSRPVEAWPRVRFPSGALN